MSARPRVDGRGQMVQCIEDLWLIVNYLGKCWTNGEQSFARAIQTIVSGRNTRWIWKRADGSLAAYAVLNDAGGAAIEFIFVEVPAACRRCGYGRALISTIEHWYATERGSTMTFKLEPRDDAIMFWYKMGYSEDNAEEDSLYLTKTIKSPTLL